MPLPPKMPPKMSRDTVGEFGLVSKFSGYQARQDQTTLDPSWLVSPSQNVIINTSGRVGSVKGYALDGVGSSVIDSGILSNFDFINFKGDVRNMRAGFLTSAANDGKLQYRYVTGTSTVNWVNLMIGLTNVRLSYTEYWDNSALVKNVLWVDGTNNIFGWNGAVTTVASATAATVTKQDSTKTWAQEGFSATGSITIGGVTATYSGGSATQTLTGVSVDFSATVAGAIVHQTPVTTALSAMTNILTTFAPTVIGCGRRNQVYVGSSTSNNLYISKVNSYTDYTFTSPVRVVGEGALIPLDSPPTKFIPLESRTDTNAYDMYVSEGSSTWAVIRATLSSDLTKETLEHIRMKVAPLQGAKSERFATKMKNHIMFVGNDNVANFLGYISYQYIPETVDFSYPIIDDMNSYDLTDGSIFYHKNYAYVAVPKSGLIRAYNMTDQTKQSTGSIRGVEDVDVGQQPWFWESAITYPVSGFYVVNGILYGHSYTTSESYQLFTGGSFNGQDISANATFAYDDKGDRSQSNGSNKLWVEGYIKQNTVLNATISGDLDAFKSTQTVTINGSDNSIVAFGAGGHALGKDNLGSKPLGGTQTAASTLPSWFHVIKTYVQATCYLEQIGFNTKGVDLQWELTSFGTNATIAAEGNSAITQ